MPLSQRQRYRSLGCKYEPLHNTPNFNFNKTAYLFARISNTALKTVHAFFFFSKKTFFEADRDSDHYQLKCHNERSLTLILTWPLQIKREKTILEIKRQKATSLQGTKRIYLLLLVESNILLPENQNGAFFFFM